MKKITIKKSQLKTFGLILINIQILTVMFIIAWYLVPKLVESSGVMFYLIATQIAAIIIAFTFSPSSTEWDGKAGERMAFLVFAGAYIGIIQVIIQAARWFYTTIEYLML